MELRLGRFSDIFYIRHINGEIIDTPIQSQGLSTSQSIGERRIMIQPNSIAPLLRPNSRDRPKLYENCCQIRREIITLIGLDEASLADVSLELGVDYELWCADYIGHDLADPFMGFCEMLRHWPSPWPFLNGSSLNGLTLAQFFLAWAFGSIECACSLLDNQVSFNGGEPLEEAGCAAISATKALMRAKHLLGSPENCLAQQENCR
jgi:hypothetical protein